jgi:adenylate kinase
MASRTGGLITVFLGAPGAGKGTQAAVVAGKLGLKHISSGDMFRRAAQKRDGLGQSIRSYMEKGGLVPDEITTNMVLQEIRTAIEGIILDGFPRNLKQAVSLDDSLAKEGGSIDSVIYIRVGEPELLRRLSERWLCRTCQTSYTSSAGLPNNCLSCGGELYQRTDDRAETVKHRLDVYFSETAPLIDYYRKQYKLFEVEGTGKVAEVTERIVSALKDKVDGCKH